MQFEPLPAPADTPLLEVPEAEFAVRDPLEVQQLLLQMQEHKASITLMAPGDLVCTTRIWSVDTPQRQLALTTVRSGPLMQTLAESQEVTAVCYLDKVKLQFDLSNLMVIRGLHELLGAPWPSCIYRFQRRDNYRVQPLASHTPVVKFRHPSIPDISLCLRVLDISLGGVSLALPCDMPLIEAGIVMRHCHLELDAFTSIDVDLAVQHVAVMNPDVHAARLGCEFVQLPGPDVRVLQAWIHLVEKRLAAMRAG